MRPEPDRVRVPVEIEELLQRSHVAANVQCADREKADVDRARAEPGEQDSGHTDPANTGYPRDHHPTERVGQAEPKEDHLRPDQRPAQRALTLATPEVGERIRVDVPV